jgi:hypothetical protein
MTELVSVESVTRTAVAAGRYNGARSRSRSSLVMQIIATPIPLLSKRFELKGPQREVGKTMAALTSYSPHRLGRNYSTSLSTDLAHKPGHRLGSKCFRITFATTLRLREIAPMTSLRITK